MPPLPRLFIGYHGCDSELARKVVCGEQPLKPSSHDYDWLGSGIYFWEDSVARAKRWAQERVKSGKYDKPGVLGAIINPGLCLDLIDPESLAMVREAHSQYAKMMKTLGRELPQNTGTDLRSRKLDCAVFRYLHQMRKAEGKEPFQTVRAFFTEGNPLYAGSGIRDLDHIQICVCDEQSITGYFLPRS